jgi:protein-disulfide isomerase
MRWVSVVAAVGLVAAMSACTSAVAGKAVIPVGTDPTADLMLTEDGFGIQIGKPFAPAAIEIFTEPQCPACADFQFFYGNQISDYLADGDLVVTYRFLTFLDRGTDGYSYMVANAFFTAADQKAGVTAEDFQHFVEEMYWAADTTEDQQWVAQIAEKSELPAEVVDRIASGDEALDVEAMDRANSSRLEELSGKAVATPTVYDVNGEQIVDVNNDDWLQEIVESS